LLLEFAPEDLFSFGGLKSNEKIYQGILKKLKIIKEDRAKLVAIDSILKNII